jgi:lipopolysaccharide cholinephosphotransferase
MKSSYIGEIMMPFEFISIPVPIGYEEILTNLYGNYQKIVMNSSLHGNVLFDTEISYKDYLKKYRKEMENKYEKIC